MANLRVDNLTGTGGRNAIDGSVAFTSSTGYLSTTIDAIGTGDFTIEWWFKATDMTEPGTANRRMFRLGANNATGSISINYDAVNNDIQWNYDATGLFNASTIKIYDNSWYHIAAVREGTGSNETKLYINGVLSDTGTLASDFTQTALQIGWDSTLGNDFGFYGNISNLRVTKRALYTAAFTPPTEKLRGVVDTILLCCQDSDDPTQEATGKTITGYGALASVGVNENLVTNGNFTTGTTGWDDSLAPSETTLSSENQRLKIVASGGTGRARQEVTGLTIGKRYKFQVRHVTCASGNCFTHLGTSSGGAEYVANLGIGDEDLHTFYFTATSTTFYIQIGITIGLTGYFDDVSLTLAEQPKAPKVLPPVGIDEGVTFEGDTKVNSQGYMYFPTGDTSQRGRGRGLMGGGTTPNTNSITFVNIQSGGTAQSFGTLTSARFGLAAFSSSTRGIFVGGATPTRLNEMEYVTIATQSNAVDFGNLEQYVRDTSAGGNNLYGFRGGGAISPAGAKTNMIDKTTIATKGNATDIGNLESNKQTLGACASPTRCVWGGGFWPANINAIQYITIASAGDTVDFGDLTNARSSLGSASSNTRGLWGGGSGPTNIIDYVELATTGNAQDFGDLTLGRTQLSATSNSIRAVFCGGYWSSSDRNIIDYVDIATTGNAKDFGDINRADNDSNREHGVCSDSHGGLS